MLLSKVIIQFNLFSLILSCTLVYHKDMTVNSFEDEPLEYASKKPLLLEKTRALLSLKALKISQKNLVYSVKYVSCVDIGSPNCVRPVLSP